MPDRIWTHRCCETTASSQQCPKCGGFGEFTGWGLTVPEAMRRYQLAYGLKPFGPHLQAAKHAFEGLRSRCGQCDGAGIRGDVYDWQECPACEGTGGVWSGAEEAIAAAYLRVVKQFPGAPAPGALSAVALVAGEAPSQRRVKPYDRPSGTAIKAAFLEAEQRLGYKWHLKGKGHNRRVTINGSYGWWIRQIARCARTFTPRSAGRPCTLYPLAIVEETARILGVETSALVAREY